MIANIILIIILIVLLFFQMNRFENFVIFSSNDMRNAYKLRNINIKNNPKNKRYLTLISKIFRKETLSVYNFINFN